MEEHKIMGYIGVIVIAIAFIGFLIIAAYEVGSTTESKEYCKSIGYDDSDRKVMGNSRSRCYKDIPHESGIGTERIYSGYLNEVEG